MARQIQGSQRDFSSGEIDVALKRADDHPARKTGLRQMANARLLNSGALQNRPGRRALYPSTNSPKRSERFTISAGNTFDIQFAAARVKIINSVGTTVANFTAMGGGGALPWGAADLKTIVYAILGNSIYITFGHAMKPQVIRWDGVSTWSIADYVELTLGGQVRTPFYRISPLGITLLPGARTGSGVSLVASSALFVAGHVGTALRWINRQMLITAVADSTHATVTILESLPGFQDLAVATDPRVSFSLSDIVIGGTSGSKGIITAMSAGAIDVQLIVTKATDITGSASAANLPGAPAVGTSDQTISFVTGETLVGPAGSIVIGTASVIQNPSIGVALWDDQVINAYRGYPGSVFVDQFRLGFCDFPSLPGGIAWSAINSPTDLYVGANPAEAMFEIAPDKVRVLYVVPGPESSEFVFCDRKLYYIPISPTNPLKPGSVQFQILSGDGAAQVQPRLAQETILYVNAGQSSLMAIIATGAYLRPFNTKSLSSFHNHLFNSVAAIATPSADASFEERYVYVLNGDGSTVCGKYDAASLAGNVPVIGWGPWSGGGTVNWVAAWAADVIFTTTYFGADVVEILDDSEYLDGALAANSAPAAFTPPGGKGPLWWMPSQSVTLIDQSTRFMGTYQIDADGFIVPQNNGGEDLTRASLIAGQPWTMTVEPFAPDAQSGADMQQRMLRRRISNFAAYVVNSTGFTLQKLFSHKETTTSPVLGTPMAIKRVSAWNVGEDATLPPKQRETVESWRPSGHSFDPRVAIIKDTPGPLQIVEIGVEISL